MKLPSALFDLKIRCIQALQIGASIAYVGETIDELGVGPVPAGVSPEQHLLDALTALEEPKASKAVEVPEPEKPEQPKGKQGRKKTDEPQKADEAPKAEALLADSVKVEDAVKA